MDEKKSDMFPGRPQMAPSAPVQEGILDEDSMQVLRKRAGYGEMNAKDEDIPGMEKMMLIVKDIREIRERLKVACSKLGTSGVDISPPWTTQKLMALHQSPSWMERPKHLEISPELFAELKIKQAEYEREHGPLTEAQRERVLREGITVVVKDEA